jgi:hypothetical protein
MITYKVGMIFSYFYKDTESQRTYLNFPKVTQLIGGGAGV